MSGSKQESLILLIGNRRYSFSELTLRHNLPNIPEGIIFANLSKPNIDPSNSSAVEVIDDPKVVDDPELISWVQKAYYVSLTERYWRGLAEVTSSSHYYLDSDEHYALEDYSVYAIDYLRRKLHDQKSQAFVKAKAAEMLAALGVDDGIDFLLTQIRSPEPTEQEAALERIREMVTDLDSTWQLDPSSKARILELTGSPDSHISTLAAKICLEQRVPGLEEALRVAIKNGHAALNTFARLLLQIATSSESLDLALPNLFQKSAGGYNAIMSDGEALLHHANPNLRERFRESASNYILKHREPTNHKQEWISDLCCVAKECDLPLLENILQNSPDNISRSNVLVAIGRLRPEIAVKYVLAKMQKEKLGYEDIAILREHASEAELDDIFTARYQNKGFDARYKLSHEDVQFLLARFGARGQNWLSENENSFCPESYTWAQWLINDLTLDQLLTDLHKASIFAQAPEELTELLAARRYNSLLSDGWQRTPLLLEETLREAGIVTAFDSNCGMIPPDNALLIRKFARNSNTRFQPECQIQLYEDLNAEHGKSYDAIFYTVCFIFLGRLYCFAAEYNGDYYNTSEVLRAMNTALRLAGYTERYIGIYDFYVFADPKLLLPIAESYFLPVDKFLEFHGVIGS
jgi:HEAT repeat protein